MEDNMYVLSGQILLSSLQKNANQSTKQKSLTPCGSQKQTRKANKNPHIVQSKLCSHHQLRFFETYLFTQYETQFTQYAKGDTPHNPTTTSLISSKSVVDPGPHESRSAGSPICCVAGVYKQVPDSLSSGNKNDYD